MFPSDRYDSLIAYYASQFGVDTRLAKAQLLAESGMEPTAVSHAGARGLAQFMEPTWSEWTQGAAFSEAFNPERAILTYCKYLRWLIDSWVAKGVPGPRALRLAVASYNWGIGNVRRTYAENPLDWEARLPKETRDYLHRVFKSPLVEAS